MTWAGPGYAHPAAAAATSAFDYFDIGLRVGTGAGSKVEWRPIGSYLNAKVAPTWGLTPGTFSFTLPPKHPLTDIITNVRRTCWHFRCGYNGLPALTGRIMTRSYDGAPGRTPYMYAGVCNKIWLSAIYAWVNPLFPPEIQIGLTGKQDIIYGPVDFVYKYYLAKNATRLNVPVYAGLPLRMPDSWSQDNLVDFVTSGDFLEALVGSALSGGAIGAITGGLVGAAIGAGAGALLGAVNSASSAGLFDEVIGLQARFPPLSELYKQSAERLELGVAMDFWDGHGTSPQVFNTDSLANLQSIIDYSSDNFLDLTTLGSTDLSGLWTGQMGRAGYVMSTKLKRDKRNVQFRTDGGQIRSYKYNESHATEWRAIVGGKSPSILNDVIEIGANLAIAALIGLLATIPGLGGLSALSVTVGDLFDDIFFAYQVFWDDEIADAIGHDDALAEGFADNTAAWSLDGYSTAHTHLKDHGGKEELAITAMGGTKDGRGITFGADNGTARRYQLGDLVTCWDRGNTVEQYVSSVTIDDTPGERCVETPSIGRDKRAKGPWDRAFNALGDVSGALRGFANAV